MTDTLMTRELTTAELRSKYLEFFRARGHAVIPSASLVPDGDGSVLFTTAGMHPLVPYLMGAPHPAGTRLADSQKCVRTNDIEEVGDLTHLTFFEMLGNWSLGDYGKKESIGWSYEFLTGEEHLGISKDLIWVTVFEGEDGVPRDEEAADIWRSLGFPDDRIIFLGREHNWWAAGPEGPCGPDTEIFIDRTQTPCAEGADKCLPGVCDCGRWFEVWNNVFMSYNKQGEDLLDLPRKNIDTGMGMERTLAVLNGVESVYETSSLKLIVDRMIALSGKARDEVYGDERLLKAVRVLSDHLRTATFMIGDEMSVRPSNTGQGYVLRRIIRRAVRYCDVLGVEPADWVEAANLVIDDYGDHYEELVKARETILAELGGEKDRFSATLAKGTKMLEKEIERLNAEGKTVLEGDVGFRLYDTYGFPVEFTVELLEEAGLALDMDRFEAAFAEHQEKSKSEAAKSGLADDSEESVRYHTATHLLHSALRKVLGDHVHQRGSNINRDRMRFDFNFERAMTKEEVAETEALVQKWIDEDIPVETEVVTVEQAREKGAIGLFNDKYGGEVSIYQIGDASLEFCGGPHVKRTSEIGTFKIKKEQSSSAGVRRIRALIS
ncbi:alanine--tRNA ligase [Parerythrobacter aestuarii]|uniref:alanine--tRNA ligase n=1 Tax=Parerythrobacter aestuarii TaxID=3020909 RepID=UPI0024DEADA5|nr:alanine--tRNA ligase [Parerythrobacter aestuarii]